ncbi:transposase [Pseudomonas fragi]|uniref:Transposase n=1 Tax=Pseudomonas fragi TaxID=296 RepID=A0A9Q6YFL9_PSEFR|nr:transposase [Pseudomonas fragi]
MGQMPNSTPNKLTSEHARNFRGGWNDKLACDDYDNSKASFEQGITKIGCMPYARHKFFDLYISNASQLAEQGVRSIGGL